MKNQKFTQEIKDNWIKALESGNYKQGYAKLHNRVTETFCCIGVLGDVCDFLNNDTTGDNPTLSYNFLEATIGDVKTKELWRTNDNFQIGRNLRPDDYKDDYSNVIGLIKELEVQI